MQLLYFLCTLGTVLVFRSAICNTFPIFLYRLARIFCSSHCHDKWFTCILYDRSSHSSIRTQSNPASIYPSIYLSNFGPFFVFSGGQQYGKYGKRVSTQYASPFSLSFCLSRSRSLFLSLSLSLSSLYLPSKSFVLLVVIATCQFRRKDHQFT